MVEIMNNALDSKALLRWAAALALPQLALQPPLITFLHFHRYDLVRPEALVEIGLVALLGLIASILILIGRPMLTAIIYALLTTVFLDHGLSLGTNLIASLQWIVPVKSGLLPLSVVIALFLFLCFLFSKLGDRARPILVSAFSVVFLTAILFPGDQIRADTIYGPAGEPRRDLPLIVHILLDEHGAISALPPELPETAAARATTSDLYIRNGFRLWDRAISRSSETERSMSAAFNGIRDLEQGLPFVASRDFSYDLIANAYFDEMIARGWRLRSIQGSHLNYCRRPLQGVDFCQTFASSSPGQFMKTGASAAQKFVVLHSAFWRESFLYYAAIRGYGRVAALTSFLPDLPSRDLIVSANSYAMFDDVAKAAIDGGRGTMVFAHLYVPHHAYALRPDCSFRPISEKWLSLNNPDVPRPQVNSKEDRIVRYRRYADQMRCVNQALQILFDRLKAAGLWQDAIVLVHGDHGSRIGRVEPDAENRPLLSAETLRDNFLTHIAMKDAKLESGVDHSPVALQDVILGWMTGRPIPPGGEYVFLHSRSQPGSYVRVPYDELFAQ